jgi:hypothetical protein
VAARVLKVEFIGSLFLPKTRTPVSSGTYLATEIRQPQRPEMTSAIALLAEPLSAWRLSKLDAEGRTAPSGPAFVLSFRELAEYIEAKRMRIVEGDFI